MNTSLSEKLVSSMSKQHYCHPLGRVGYRAVHHIINNDPPDQFKVPPALIVNMGRSKGYQKSDCCSSNPLLFDLQRMKPVVYVALLTLAATCRGGRGGYPCKNAKASSLRWKWQPHGHLPDEHHDYPLVMSKKLLKMAIEIADLPIKNSDFP